MTWLLLGAVLTLTLVPSNMVATALTLLQVEWGASATGMGWVFASYQVGYVAAVLLLLPLTDRVPPGRVIVACSLATVVASMSFPLLARDVWSASLLRAVAGASLAGVYMPGVRVVAAAVPAARRGFFVGLYVSAFYLGTSLSLLGTGVLLDYVDWRGASLVLGIVSAAGLPLAVWAAQAAPPTPAGGTARLRPAVLRSEPIARTIAGYMGHSWELYVSRGWMAAYLTGVLAARGLGPVEAAADGGKWAALMAGLGIVGVWWGGWLSDRVGRAATAAAFALASGLLSLAFGWIHLVGWEVLLLAGCIYGVIMAADSPIYSTAITELAPPGQVGSAQAAQASLGFLASAISPVAAGIALDLGGDYSAVFILAGAASLLGAWALRPLMARGAGSI